MRYEFGEFTLDTSTGRLNGPRGEQILRRQAWRLLVELLECAPAMISHDALLDRVWGRQALSPNALPQTISELRQALGDCARSPRYIETLRGRGYRMVCPVTSEPQQVAAEPAVHRRYVLWSSTVLLLLVFGAAGWLAGSDRENARNLPAAASLATEPSAEDSPAERLRRQAELAESRWKLAAAAAHWRALSALQPGNVEVLKSLVRAELDTLQGERARASLRRLTDLRAAAEDPEVRLLMAEVALLDGQFDRAHALTSAVLDAAMQSGTSGLITAAAMLSAEIDRRRGDIGSGRVVLEDVAENAALRLDENERAGLLVEAAALAREGGELKHSEALIDQVRTLEPDKRLRQRLRLEEAMLDIRNGRPERAWQSLQNLLAGDGRPDAPEFDILLYNALGLAGIDSGRLDEASDFFERAAALAQKAGGAMRVAGLQVNAGVLLVRQGRWEEADALWTRALEVFERIGDRRGQATSLGNLAASASSRGLNERARELNEKALTHFRALGLEGDRARTAFNLALLASRGGRLDEAEALLAEAQAAYRDHGDLELMLHVGAFRVEQRLLAGDYEQARRLLWDLETQLGEGSFLRQAAVHAARGRLTISQGNLGAARSAFERARSLREQAGHEDWVRASRLDLLGLDLLEGVDPWGVRVEAEELARHFAASSQPRDAVRGWLIAVGALLSLGERDEALVLLERARNQARAFDDAALALELDWLAAWTGRSEERKPRLRVLARQAREKGYLWQLARIRASLSGRGGEHPAPGASSRPREEGRIPLPPYAAIEGEDA